ncbi:MAG: hypothetical protein KDI51_20200 [Xanthomonadales bacterium]|nr:hypothetical protein [Xanthomonadales bacterium]
MSDAWPTVKLELSGTVLAVHVGDVSKRSDRERLVVRVHLRLSAAARALDNTGQAQLPAGREVGLVATQNRWLRHLGRLPRVGENLNGVADPQGEPWLALQSASWPTSPGSP